jgi:hypothetical protein
MLILKRASKFRPSGEWSDDDYDVFDGDQHIGRIILHPQAPEGELSFWTITGSWSRCARIFTGMRGHQGAT